MAISRSLMNRQLQADGGIMQVSPREKFGLGSKLKRFVRKIIPNEVADIAVKAAPFVAPFNPAVAAAMSGLGTFDQTGSIGDSLKRGALTYGLGQGARYLGGAGFQGNPFSMTGGATGGPGAFRGGLEGFKSGFGSPIGTETGFKLGQYKMFGGDGVQQVNELKGVGDSSGLKESTFIKDATVEGMAGGDTISTITKDTIVRSDPSIFELVKQGDYGDALMQGAKKFGKAMFTIPDGKGGFMVDKAAVMGAVAFAASYAEALALADEAGIELTEEEYDEARKQEKKEEYAGYLSNFFAGRKDGGRIGFKKGSPEEPSEIGIMTIDVEAGGDDMDDMDDMLMAGGINFSRQEKSYLFRRLGGSGGSDRSYTMPNLYRILSNPNKYPEDAAILKEIAIMGLGESKAEGGRIGFSEGMNEARQLLLNKKYLELLKEYSEAGLTDADSRALKEANEFVRDFKMADGGRIGYKSGANRVSELLILRDELLGKGEDVSDIEAEIFQLTGKTFRSVGGISDVPTGKIRKNSAGIKERDYRDEGGFVPVGIKEKADDVPAMLSKNEFVITADAVRGIGGGDVEKGSKKLYNLMKNAEQVGRA
jgi:predicted RNase H-like HicB family nuclease